MSRPPVIQDRRGFTLAELLVTVALSGIIASAAFAVLQSGLAGAARVEQENDELARLAVLVDLVAADIASSQGFASVAADRLVLEKGKDHTVDWYFDTGPGGAIELYRHEERTGGNGNNGNGNGNGNQGGDPIDSLRHAGQIRRPGGDGLLVFEAMSAQRVRLRLTHGERELAFSVSCWGEE